LKKASPKSIKTLSFQHGYASLVAIIVTIFGNSGQETEAHVDEELDKEQLSPKFKTAAEGLKWLRE
jgi:hypothetical protein